MPPHAPELGECWTWNGFRDDLGYGKVGIDGKSRSAHRVAYCAAHGTTLEALTGLEVCHKCDNPSCVRPEHLFLGTHADNMADCSAKRRTGPRNKRGERNMVAKLREADIPLIRCAAASGEPLGHIAERFGVHKRTIQDVVSRITWNHVA